MDVFKDALVIDDDDGIRKLVAAALRRLSVSCDTAIDGADALDHISSTHYSVILVDLMMPRLDGACFVTELREREKTSTERPVVLMMTAFTVRDRPPHLGDKVQAVIQKPFDVFEIAELVRDCVEGRRLFETRSDMGDRNAERNEGDVAVDSRPPEEN